METKNAPKSRRLVVAVFVLVFAALAVSTTLISTSVSAQKGKGKMSALTIDCDTSSAASINIKVTAGVTGAPAGFSIQWQTKADFDQYGWPTDSSCPADIYSNQTCGDSFCKASFSGNANGSSYNLAALQTVSVKIGDTLYDDPGASSNCSSTPLKCNTEYVFRAFAHANSSLQRSDFTDTITCKTESCSDTGENCTYTQGYWKSHGPDPLGNNVNDWPVSSLTLGTVVYTDQELLAIFNTPGAGNGLLTLAHQLIAAKLNIANGADPSAVAGAIAAADTLIGGLVVPPVGTGSLPNSSTSSLVATLTSYNEGDIGPGHCQ
jgi:hypothetical protein